jgi:uncharacterized protein YbbK (DUF523 family)
MKRSRNEGAVSDEHGSEDEVWLVSACLLGHACRYDGAAAKESAQAALRVLEDRPRVPVCPEVAGGLPTPRTPAQLDGGDGEAVLDGRARVVDDDGVDVTEAFLRGAERAVAAARAHGATAACLKAHSPSCGAGQTHDKSGLIAGDGVTAAALRRAGLRVLSDEALAAGGDIR